MKLILHVGSHKTGTTSIQSTLAENRDWLLERGFFYPNITQTNHSHNEFAHRLAVADTEEIDAIRKYISAIGANNSTTILSAEEFSARIVGNRQWRNLSGEDYWPQRIEYLRRLKYCLQDYDDIKVFFCLRRSDEFAESLYATKLLSQKSDFSGSFEQFLQKVSGNFAYAQHVAAFTESFPETDIKSFDELVGDLVPNFFRWTSIPLPPGVNPVKKTTPNLKLVYWFYRWSETFADVNDGTRKLAKKFVKSADASGSVPPGEPATFWKNEHERSDFVAKSIAGLPVDFFQMKPVKDRVPVHLNDADFNSITRAFNAWLAGRKKSHK